MQRNDAVLRPGTTFEGRYEIVAKLGEGGFGAVHKARQLSTGQLIALKILRLPDQGNVAQTAARVARFLRETRLCAQLRHPNIVQLIDSGQTPDGTLYIAFAFAPGDNLGTLLELEGPLAPREARYLMLQVLDALACAHAEGVVHRDLKPSNIMVIPTGARRNALVLDFGIGVMIDDERSTRLTGSHEGLGTPGYGAPEQWRGADPSPRADLFSWGLVFLECLTGKAAYAGTAADIFYQLLGPDPVPMPTALAHHPLGEVLARAVAKDPSAREVTARGLLQALEACDLRGLSREARLGAGGDFRSGFTGPTAILSQDRPAASSVVGGERRQLTALCCRVSVHAGEAQVADSEGLDDPLREALAACADVGRRHGGYVAGALGDQLLIYFGYPSAAEDDARRAARAALAMAGAGRSGDERSARTEVSVGVHTGVVVEGDLADLERAWLITGATPRLVVQLAALAPRGSILVSGASQRLLRTSFELEPGGSRAMDGLAAPVETFRLSREHSDAERPTPDGSKAPISGRDPELGLLEERWRRACQGSGQASLITGEPGIGKSRLARALRDRVAREAHTFLEARCAPDTQNSALAPVVDLLERALGLDQEPDPGGKTAQIERALAGHGFALPEVMPLFLPLFSLPISAPYHPLEVSPPRQKALTLQAILSLLFAMADKRPLLLLVEDLHWADPTTMEFLAQLVRETPQVPICLVMTARPELPASFPTAGVMLLPLGRLERPQIADMLAALAHEKPLPPAVIDYVADRADGVPLFVEELLRMMLDAGLLAERDDRHELTGPLSGSAIPGTLRALLTARLDRLGRAKETAQVAAALGREFSLEVLSAASPLGPAAVADDLERLTSAGLVQRRRRGKEVIGVFKHALVRDAAYESLTVETVRRVHARIAATLEDRFHGIVETRPDLLAYHHAAAEQKRVAIGYARKAAAAALTRSAYEDAASHANAALEWLGSMPRDAKRTDIELELNGIVLQALMSTQGWASAAVGALGEKSRALLPASTVKSHTASVLFGLYMHYHVASERAQSHRVADELLAFAEQISDESLQAVAATAKGVSFHADGRFLDAETWLERARTLYDPARDRDQGASFGMDCRVWATAQLAVVVWSTGETTRAFRLAQEAIDWAREVRHVPSLGIGLLYLGRIYQMANDKAGAKRTTDELLAAAATYGLPAFEGYGAAIAAWIEGDLQGVAKIIGVLESLHCYLSLTYHGSLLADIEADAGNIQAAIAHTETYLAMCSERAEHAFEADLARRRALYELRRSEPDRDVARAWFIRAYDLARDQSIARFEAAAIRDYQRAFAGEDHAALLDRLRQIYDTRPELETEERLS